MLNRAGFRFLNGQGYGAMSSKPQLLWSSSVSVSHSELWRPYVDILDDPQDSKLKGVVERGAVERLATPSRYSDDVDPVLGAS
jgi:hypothetical protein